MNIVDICKYLKISPLIRKIGTAQESSNQPIDRILAENYRAALNQLAGGAGPTAQANITTAFFTASEALTGHQDLFHLIKTPQELGGILECISLDEIQPVLLKLINMQPTEKGILEDIFQNNIFDKAIAALSVFTSGPLAIAAGGYLIYRLSQNTYNYAKGEKPATQLDNLIQDAEALKNVLEKLPEVKVCDALMIIRHIKNYSGLVKTTPEDQTPISNIILGLNIPVEKILDRFKSLLSKHNFNLVRSMLEDETCSLNNHIQESYLINLVEIKILKMFSNQEEEYKNAIILFSCLELINVFDKYTSSEADFWKTQVDAYQMIVKLMQVANIAYNTICSNLDINEKEALNDILKLELPEKFYSFLCSALVNHVEFDINNMFTAGRKIHYFGEEAKSITQAELHARIDGCIPTIMDLLQPRKLTRSHSTSGKDEHHLDDESGSEGYHSADENEETRDEAFVIIRNIPPPIITLEPEELRNLSQDMMACIEENCKRILQKSTTLNSQEVTHKKISYLTKCYVTLKELDLDKPETIEHNKLTLFSVCALIFIISTIETNRISSITKPTSNRIDSLFSTHIDGSISSKEILEIFKKYHLTIPPHDIRASKNEVIKIIRCFDNGLWPITMSAMLKFHYYLIACEPPQLNSHNHPLDISRYIADSYAHLSFLSDQASNVIRYCSDQLSNLSHYLLGEVEDNRPH